MPTHFLFLLLALTHTSCTADPWNYVDHFAGVWSVEKITTSRSSLAYSGGHSEVSTLNNTKGAYDGVLLGVQTTSDAESRQTSIKIQSDGAGAGLFTTQEGSAAELPGLDDDDEDFSQTQNALKFEYDFRVGQLDIRASQGRYTSTAQASTKVHGNYQYLIPSNNQFILILTPDSPDADLVTYLGKRVTNTAEPTFLQKFGPSILIASVFFGSKAITGRLGVQQRPQGRPSKAE